MIPNKSKLFINLLIITFILIIGFLIGYFIALELKEADLRESYKVVEIIDGDTIKVKSKNQALLVRLIGIDAPEIKGPYTEEECFGKEAKEMLSTLLEDREVYLIPDPLGSNVDKHGRLLRYVFLPDGTLVNAKLIQEGYAFNYIYGPFQFMKQFDYLEKQAKQNKKGLWSGKCNYY